MQFFCYKYLTAKTKHLVFGFVGDSGSGKSTLMIELLNFFPHLEIIKSTSTRARRDDTDDLFYKLVGMDYMDNPENQKNFLNHEIYAGNHYVYERSILDQVLRSHCGMFAIIESAVPKIQKAGYDVRLIKVVPIVTGIWIGLESARAKTSFAPRKADWFLISLSKTHFGPADWNNQSRLPQNSFRTKSTGTTPGIDRTPQNRYK
ncbi:MAG: hypothetical protein KW788_00930 [Candidatus Doudnabacteria bacterium]|nr:hypothetical protein [Candidatus Doudnabacteria bacterium]